MVLYYAITCQSCSLICVGETSRCLAVHFSEHLADVHHNRSKPVAQHFNSAGHTMADVKKKKKRFCLNSNDFGFICAGVSNVVSYIYNINKTSDITWVVCYKLTAIWASSKNYKLTTTWASSKNCLLADRFLRAMMYHYQLTTMTVVEGRMS